MMYRRTNIEVVEAWQVGSDEAIPKWILEVVDIQNMGAIYNIYPKDPKQYPLIANKGDFVLKDKDGQLSILTSKTFNRMYVPTKTPEETIEAKIIKGRINV